MMDVATQHCRWMKRVLLTVLGKEVHYRPQFICSTRRFGAKDAAWDVAEGLLNSDSIVYSFGVGEDISFDLELISAYGLQVHAFDPTPKSIAWLQGQALPPQMHFYPCGIGARDGEMHFYPPPNPAHVSHSVVQLSKGTAPISLPVKRLATIMRDLGHRQVDLLKLDVEGSEYDVLGEVLASGVEVRQILVEFHHRFDGIGVEKTKAIVRALNARGYLIVSISPRWEEYSFLQVTGR